MIEPVKNYISFYRNEGKYNMLDSNQVSAQYVITGISREAIKEKGLTVSFLIDEEHDYNLDSSEITVLELLDELAYVYENKYLWNSSTKDIVPIKEYLESIEEEQEALRHQYKVDLCYISD